MPFILYSKILILCILICYLYLKDRLYQLFKLEKFKYGKNSKDVAICIVCKDDAECLIESIEYHSLIGVDHFIIYDNDSAIPLAKVLREYKNVTVINWPAKNLKQSLCYLNCLNKFKSKFKWIGFIDTDEFIVLKNIAKNSKNKVLNNFIKQYEKYGGIGINILCFGGSGHLKKQKSIINSFTEARTNHKENDFIKTIVNTKYVLSPSRNPHAFIYKHGYFCVNENFKNISVKTKWFHAPLTSDRTHKKIQVNHYITRSREDFELKRVRCKHNAYWDVRLSDEFWDSFQGGTKDTSILDLIKNINWTG